MKRLTLTYRGQAVVSKIFSMGAYRAMLNTSKYGIPTSTMLDAAAHEAVIFMFDGTEITEDILSHNSEIDGDELVAAYEKVLKWFHDVKIKSGGKEMVGTPPDDPILCIYKKLLINSGALPDEIDRQDPQLFFDVWCADEGDMVSVDEIPDSCKELYGL